MAGRHGSSVEEDDDMLSTADQDTLDKTARSSESSDDNLWEKSDSDDEEAKADGDWPVKGVASSEVDAQGKHWIEVDWSDWARRDGTSTTWQSRHSLRGVKALTGFEMRHPSTRLMTTFVPSQARPPSARHTDLRQALKPDPYSYLVPGENSLPAHQHPPPSAGVRGTAITDTKDWDALLHESMHGREEDGQRQLRPLNRSSTTSNTRRADSRGRARSSSTINVQRTRSEALSSSGYGQAPISSSSTATSHFSLTATTSTARTTPRSPSPTLVSPTNLPSSSSARVKDGTSQVPPRITAHHPLKREETAETLVSLNARRSGLHNVVAITRDSTSGTTCAPNLHARSRTASSAPPSEDEAPMRRKQKSKAAGTVVTSDSDDDDIPISRPSLPKRVLPSPSAKRRYLVTSANSSTQFASPPPPPRPVKPLPGKDKARVDKGKRRDDHPLRTAVEHRWSESAREMGSAGVKLINVVDNEEVPEGAEEFEWIERGYDRNHSGAPPLPERGHFAWCGSECLCLVDMTCECLNMMGDDERDNTGPVYDEDGLLQVWRSEDGLLQARRNEEVVECNPYCACPPICRNRVAQRPREAEIEVFKTRDGRGWGVRTSSAVEEGRVLGIYSGALMPANCTHELEDESYVFRLDFMGDAQYAVDSRTCGNWTRFINHSCAPNLAVYPVVYDTVPGMGAPYIGFYAKRDILPGEELAFDYDPEEGRKHQERLRQRRDKGRGPFNRARLVAHRPADKRECCCGSEECRGYI